MTTFDSIAVGDTLTTQSRTITEADLVNYAGVSGDFNYLHTDSESMADSPFGERIAHGGLVFSVMTGLLWQARGEDDVAAFYGVDRLRFVAPVLVGDTLRVESEVVEIEETDRAGAEGKVRQQVEVLNQEDEVVLSCESLALLR